jgi:hypothetical protein
MSSDIIPAPKRSKIRIPVWSAIPWTLADMV